MCTTCGCSDGAKATVNEQGTGPDHSHGAPHRRAHHHDHDHVHDHDYVHDHDHLHRPDHDRPHTHDHVHTSEHAPVGARGTTVPVLENVLAKNDRAAERNRGWFAGRNILALNLVSSPGAGKTTLLESTIRGLRDTVTVSVVEGDQETTRDAERIRATGCRSIQVNTGTGCHLEAGMVADALAALDPPTDSVVMIENVGNLVCPALFDLGEQAKVVILSVTEGDDKPLKYPHMFRAASLMIVSKTDLLPYVDFDVDACVAAARRVNRDIEVLQVSATTGEGMPAWQEWLRARFSERRLESAS